MAERTFLTTPVKTDRMPPGIPFIIGNEVNATRFWSPQHTADDPDAGPRSYEKVLAACYSRLKAVSSEIDDRWLRWNHQRKRLSINKSD